MATTTKLLAVVAFLSAATFVAMKLMHDRSNVSWSVDPNGLVSITPQRIAISRRDLTLCFIPPPAGPHDFSAEIHIYANKAVLDYRRAHPNKYDYPIGSKFVKEKYSQAGDRNPDAATIMERRASTGDVSDWNFSIVSLPDKTPVKATGRVTCVECHEGYKDTGYVSHESEAALRNFLAIE
jgi:hypothetical protein